MIKVHGRVLLIALSVVLSTTVISGEAIQICKGFLPENDMKIPVGTVFPAAMGTAGLNEAQFNEVIDKIESIYRPEIERAGNTLKVNRNWSDSTVNASAQLIQKQRVLNMYGGLARHPRTTREGFALVICHEIGHHLGGAPKIGQGFNNWASNEGASDYFATLKCLRRFFADEDNAAILQQASADIDPLVKERCEGQFVSEYDQLLCQRTSLGGKSVAYLFQDLRKEKNAPTFNTPDMTVVKKTDDNHPGTQCRMDTYFAGMTCVSKVNEAVDNRDFRQGTCYSPRDEIGTRPLCWFAEK